MNSAIGPLAVGAVRTLLENGVTDINIIRHEALLDCLPIFVKIVGRQPTWQEVEQFKKAIEGSIKYHTRSADKPEDRGVV